MIWGKAARRTAAIVVAAGSSQRMGQDKLWLSIGGTSVIERTLRAFEEAETVERVIVVTRAAMVAQMSHLCREAGLHKVSTVVEGGDTRQRSVAAGLAAVAGGCDFVCIHDGARPLVRPQDIDAVNRCAWQCGAAALAVPVKDTVKFTDADGVVQQTPDRSRLWLVQTPQVFDAVQFAEAMAFAEKSGEQFTDDCQLMERMGRPVQLYRGRYSNIKITTPEDALLAQALLQEDV